MSFFEEDPQRKSGKKQKKETVEEQMKDGKRKTRRKIQKNTQKTEEKKAERFNPPLMIRARVCEEEQEQPLQNYVKQLYQVKDKEAGQDRLIQNFVELDDDGNIGYKLKLVKSTEDRLDYLAAQMQFRIKEGHGEAYYRIGVEDNGKPLGLCYQEMLDSLKTICSLAGRIDANVMVFRVTQGLKGLVVELIIVQRHRLEVKLQIRILLFGQTGSGKSTLLGVMKSGLKDNGKGQARLKVFTHQRQFMTGSTQSRSHHVIGFDTQGRPYSQQSKMLIENWRDNSNKLLTFIDVGGHKKAQKQIVSSICSFFPQYALWVVSGLSSTPKSANTIQLANIFRLPLIVVITHLDMMSQQQVLQAVLRIKEQLKKFCPDKTLCLIKQMEHAVLFSRITQSQNVIPIFLVSNVTGHNLDLLTSFLNLLTAVSELKNNENLSTQFSISDKYIVDGKLVLAGTVLKGLVKRGQLLHIGPDLTGCFRTIQIVSIQCLRVPVKLAKCGQICTICIRPLCQSKQWLQKQSNAIRRGMVMVDNKLNPKAVYQFLVQLMPYSNECQEIKITQKYQPVINTLTIRQICNIINIKSVQDLKVPLKVLKKESQSIDSIKSDILHQSYRNNNKILHHHIVHNQSIDKPHKFLKTILKKQVDLTLQASNKDQNGGLTQIEQQQAGSKKWREVKQIRFIRGKSTPVRLRFKYYPQYITVGQKVIIDELKLVGKVKEIYY